MPSSISILLHRVITVLLVGHCKAFGFGFGAAPPSVPLSVAAANPFPFAGPCGPAPFCPGPCGAAPFCPGPCGGAPFCPPPPIIFAPPAPFFPPFPPPPPYPGFFKSLLFALLAKKGKFLPPPYPYPPPYPFPPPLPPPPFYPPQHSRPQEHVLKVHVIKDFEDDKRHHHHPPPQQNHWHDMKPKWN